MPLTRNEISAFNDLCGEKIAKEINGHTLEISYYKTVPGIKKAECSCGKRFRTRNVGNRAGCAYQRLGLKERWNEHIKAVGGKPCQMSKFTNARTRRRPKSFLMRISESITSATGSILGKGKSESCRT